MAEDRTFTLIGNFTDNITPKLRSINEQIEALNGTIARFKSNGRSLSREFASVATSLSAVSSAARANRIALRNSTEDLEKQLNLWKKLGAEQAKVSRYTPPRISGGGGGRTTVPGGGGGSPYSGIGIGGVVQANLIANAITGAFRMGVNIVQDGMSTVFNALAERSKDQMEDIASAGGIYSAGQFSNVKGLPNTFQGAMDLQNKMNKELAAMASNLPGTTHDFVENGRRLTDTISLVMAKDSDEFKKIAAKMTGNVKIGTEEAFIKVTDELTKRTTLLEKINPARTVVPMSQLVEDMIKQDKVSIGGLRKYVAFRRGTTFQAALDRHIEDVNKTGASTAARIEAINKLLEEAVPQPMINAMQRSVSGVVEGFRSALLDPDVGIFGLSRNLSTSFKKFNAETGAFMSNMDENINLFKVMSDIFGNLGNLINNSIMPGLFAIYNPFEEMAKGLAKFREFTFKIFERQQRYTQYFDDLAGKYGMTKSAFKVAEKGGVSTVMDLLYGAGGLSSKDYQRFRNAMEAKGSEAEIAKNMKGIYSQIIPAVFKSPLFSQIGEQMGTLLANFLKQIASLMDTLLSGNAGTDAFTRAFVASGGQEAVNKIIVDILEGIWRVIKYVVKTYLGALGSALSRGNFAVAGLLSLGLLPAIIGLVRTFTGFVKIIKAARAAMAVQAAVSAGTEIAGTAAGAAGASMTQRYMRLSENRMAGTILRPAVGAGIGAAETAGAGVAGGLAAGGGLAAAAAPIAIGAAIFLGAALLIKGVYDISTGAAAKQAEAAEQQRFAGYLQKQSAELQAQSAKLNNAGAQALNTFGSAANFKARLGLVGATGPQANAASKAYFARNEAAEQANKFFKFLTDAQKSYAQAGYSQERIKELTAPLERSYRIASDNLNKRNAELDRAISALGPKIATALADSLRTMPTNMIESAISNKISSLDITVKPFEIAPGINTNPLLNLPPARTGKNKFAGVFHRARGSAYPESATSLANAISFENAHKPPGSSLVIANSSETIIPAAAMGYFPSASLIGDKSSNRAQQTSVNAPITIYQQPGQSPKELAALVAMEISNAVADVRNSSYYV